MAQILAGLSRPLAMKQDTVKQLREFAALPEFEETQTAALMLAAADELEAERARAAKVCRWILQARARLVVGETQEDRTENATRSPLPVRLWMIAQGLTAGKIEDDRTMRIASDEICNEQRRKLGLPEHPPDPMIALLHGTPR
jgi:hypothetical protein